jgi:hypothetical protein
LRPNRYNQYESRALTIDAAQKICNEYGVTLDWLFLGDRTMLTQRLALEIARIEAAEQKSFTMITLPEFFIDRLPFL